MTGVPSHLTDIWVITQLKDGAKKKEQLMSNLRITDKSIRMSLHRLTVRKIVQYNQTDGVYELTR